MSQIKPFTSITYQYVNNIFAVTVKTTFVMSYHELIVYFESERFARFEVFISVINTSLQRKNSSSLTGEGRGCFSNFAFARIFCKWVA